MDKVLQFIKNQALPIAIITGCIFHDFFGQFAAILPYNLFLMLFISFSKVPARELKPKKVHFLLLTFVIVVSLLAYWAVSKFNTTLAESILVVTICPTATSAIVVVNKLGGNGPNVVTYTIISNIAVSIIIPLLFPLIHLQEGLTFWEGVWTILKKVFTLLVLPMVASELVKHFIPKFNGLLVKYNSASFYLWACSVVILMANMMNSIIDNPQNYHIDILMAVASLVICIVLYIVGKQIGSRYDDRISCGQAIGQKNTIFAIWVAQTYLTPLSAVGCSFYILWQNLFNSWQLQKKREMDKKIANDVKKSTVA
ncbi:MAG: bile acid:sodium symporter [Bacteroidales bacterium]|jgi:BASS family bile acid:Na+ symporter|nr:bile acid:sodium symporter [Bacteroidales bacterium]